MGEIVNLRRARKRKAREDAAAVAAERAVAPGVSLAARRAARSQRELVERRGAGHRLEAASIEPEDNGERAREP